MHTKGNIKTEDIKVGDIHYEFEYGLYIKCEVLTTPVKTVDKEEGDYWTWKPPKYVKLNISALRLRGDVYYRDAGQWEVGYKFIDGELVSWYPNMGHPELHRQPLIKITEEEYKNDNKGYI